MTKKWVWMKRSDRMSTEPFFLAFITKGRNSKGQRKIRPKDIQPNFQKAILNFRPKIKKRSPIRPPEQHNVVLDNILNIFCKEIFSKLHYLVRMKSINF